jgi:hypothetical protein
MSQGAAALISQTKITHVATGETVECPFVIQSFDYDISPEWTGTTVYGRMDPIYTYQRTSRSFTAVLRSPAAGEVFTSGQMDALISSGIITREEFSPPPGRQAENVRDFRISGGMLKSYLTQIASLFKFMYPTYQGPNMNVNKGVGFMRASPLLRLSLNGITFTGTNAQGTSKGLLFVPETFNVSSITSAEGVAVSIGSAADMKFAAPAGGYNISLGGTILHEENRVGWVYNDDTSSWSFAQGENFPYSNQIDPSTPGTVVPAGAARTPGVAPPSGQTARGQSNAGSSQDAKALQKLLGTAP